MPATEPERRLLDAAALARAAARIDRAVQPPWLHGEAARRMADKLTLIRRTPASIVDWRAASGAGGALLKQAYPKATVVAIETSPGLPPPQAQPRAPWWRPRKQPPAQPELLWANMALHFAADPQALFRRWHELLATDGFLMFSTLGPGTLQALQRLYASAGWGVAFAPFVDMHDLGDMLVEAGFAEPVMDQETITITWPDAAAALAELRSFGANVHPQRHAGLRTPRWRQALLAALAARCSGRDGRIALDVELVYGHAFKPPPRAAVAAETRVPLDEMRAMVRRRRQP